MKISDVEIYQYSLNLNRPFTVAGKAVYVREGLILRLILSDGKSALGEIAPLPGVSSELLKKALHQLKQLRVSLINRLIPHNYKGLQELSTLDVFQDLCPSVSFGIQTAFINLLSQIRAESPIDILKGVKKDLHIAGLVQGTPEEITGQVQELLKLKCRTFKLKVGSRNIPLDVKKFQIVSELIGPENKIRLDVNRAWQIKEAVAFCKNISYKNVEFIEEPVKDPQDLQSFIDEAGLDVALDETLREQNTGDLYYLNGVKFFVLKPTLLGEIFKSIQWIEDAKRNQKSCIISSSFESGIGLRMLACLASLTTMDAGLGTSDWMREDLLDAFRKPDHYIVDGKKLTYQWTDVRSSLLKLLKV